jgi:hypothetical protein
MNRTSPAAGGESARPEATLTVDGALLLAWLGPLPLESARAALPRQAGLIAPAKVVLSAHGEGGILAEVIRNGDSGFDTRCAQAAIESARGWLADRAAPPGDESGAVSGAEIEGVLEQLGQEWEAAPEGGYRVHARARDVECRVELRSLQGRLIVTTLPVLMRAGAASREAVQMFALRSNRRLRLARLTVADAGDDLLRVQCDTVLASSACLEQTLATALDAVVGARAETARPLRALCTPRLAEAYLDLVVRQGPGRRASPTMQTRRLECRL